MTNQQTRYVALLRGVNVGGHNTVNMAELKTCFEELGYVHVQTYINSGNVLFAAPTQDSAKLAGRIEKGLDERFPLPICVVIRSQEELHDLIEAWPAGWKPEGAGYKYDIIFLSPAIDSPKVLDNFKVVPGVENLSYQPGVLFWSIKLSDFRKSGLTKVTQMPIYQEMTVRGPGTVRKIYELMRGE